MSDKDQPEESTYSDLSSDFADDSVREVDTGEPESELPSFDAYGDDEEWGALDDDESLSGDPEWTGDNLATLEPDSPKDPNMPPPAAPNLLWLSAKAPGAATPGGGTPLPSHLLRHV